MILEPVKFKKNISRKVNCQRGLPNLTPFQHYFSLLLWTQICKRTNSGNRQICSTFIILISLWTALRTLFWRRVFCTFYQNSQWWHRIGLSRSENINMGSLILLALWIRSVTDLIQSTNKVILSILISVLPNYKAA